MKPVFRFLCILAGTLCLGMSALATPTDLTDIPLRTKNRAKPNIMLMLDNTYNSHRTFAPDYLKNIWANFFSAYNGTTFSYVPATGGAAQPVTSFESPGDFDWHYRASGNYASGGSCTATQVCTLGGANSTCPGSAIPSGVTISTCTELFNQLYYDPTQTYTIPYKASRASGTTTLGSMPLPQDSYNNTVGDLAYIGTASNCACSDVNYCAWLDGYNTSAGCVDLKKNFSTAPYPAFKGQLFPWGSGNVSPAPAKSQYYASPDMAGGATGNGPYPYLTSSGGTIDTNGVVTVLSNFDVAVASGSPGTLYGPTLNPVRHGATSYTLTSAGGSTYTLGPDAPSSWSSPYYCDIGSMAPPTTNTQFATINNKCDPSKGTVWSNPGPADFFDPNGVRHVITDGTDLHFKIPANVRNFVIWHSFYRTRLLATKTALNTAIKDNLNSNFRVGLSAVVNGAQTLVETTPGDQYTFGAYSSGTLPSYCADYATCHYFSPVADFSDELSDGTTPWRHMTEWYGRLAALQTNPTAVSGGIKPDYIGNLHNLYRWFTGVFSDPAPPGGTDPVTGYAFRQQSEANSVFNTGADSQYFCSLNAFGSPDLNSDGTCKTPIGRNGPLMYSCQANFVAMFPAAPQDFFSSSTPPPNLAGTGNCHEPVRGTPYSNAPPCDFGMNAVTPSSTAGADYALPQYFSQAAFCDAALGGTFASCTGGSSGNTYSGNKISYNANWPWLYSSLNNMTNQGSVSAQNDYANDNLPGFYGTSSQPLNSFANLALYYWSHDLNQEFNNQKDSSFGGAVPVSVPDQSGRLGVPGTPLDKATWPHVTTYFINLALPGQCNYSTYPYPVFNTTGTTIKTCIGTLDLSAPAKVSGLPITGVSPTPAWWPAPSFQTHAITATDFKMISPTVDDMARAAANGHGQFITATGSAAGSTSLNSAFNQLFFDVNQLLGSESAVAVANTQVKTGGISNYAFQSFYNSNGWWGDLVSSPISATDGSINPYYADATQCAAQQAINPLYQCQSTDGWSALYKLRSALCTVAACATSKTSFQSTNAAATGAATATTGRKIITDNGANGGLEFSHSTLTGITYTAVLQTYNGATGRGDTSNLVDYLRGDNTNESCVRSTCSSGAACYRCRYIPAPTSPLASNKTILQSLWHPLGDMVDAEAVAVATPAFQYTYDATYTAFKTAQASRAPVIYQAANDGMLHAFKIGTHTTPGGQELWAYVPSFVIPNLGFLANPCKSQAASSNCTATHKYFVNATPVSGDVNFHDNDNTLAAGSWHTILVGGLGKGGRGYYALDVTEDTLTPSRTQTDLVTAAPTGKVLWTFPNKNTTSPMESVTTSDNIVYKLPSLGYSYGRPAIGRVQNASGNTVWAVILSSGYNNGTYSAGGSDDPNSGSGDGKGRLYVLDAKTGNVIQELVTPCGTNTAHPGNTCDSSNPSGFAYFSARVLDPTDRPNIQEVYGGDLLGNVWKFDLTGLPSTWQDKVTRLASLVDSTGAAQPVTSEPELAMPDGTTLMVYVGTGKYLGAFDIPNGQLLTSRQSLYALKAVPPATSGADPTSAYVTAVNGARGAIDAAHRIDATNSDVFSYAFCPVPTSINRCLKPGTTQSTTSTDWVFDLPRGESIITNPQIVLSSLIFTSSVPLSDPCQPGGKSYFYMLDYRNGGMLPGASSVAQTLLDPVTGDSVMASRPTVIQLPDGRISVLGASAVGTTLEQANPGSNVTRRISWREVPNLP